MAMRGTFAWFRYIWEALVLAGPPSLLLVQRQQSGAFISGVRPYGSYEHLEIN
jgi:hypothetical protein